MNVVVCMKVVPSSETKVIIGSDGKSIDRSNLVFEINAYDEYAIEEALKAREANEGKVTILTLGPATATQTIRKALAMGADEAVHLVNETAELADSLVVAEALANAIKDMEYDLVFCGKKAIDSDNHQVPNRVAQLLGIKAVTAIEKLDLTADSAKVVRSIEGGEETVELSLPCLLSAEKGLNEPRYASLPGIMAAKKKPLEERPVELSSDKLQVVAMELPPPKPAGRIVGEGPDAAAELVQLLRNEAKVL